MTKMFGIPNCDTIKKAKSWLQKNNISFDFHDYKKLGVDETVLHDAIDNFGLELVLNKRGTTYRKLSDETKASINSDNVVGLLTEHPSMIKRPILLHNKKLIIGFNDSIYQEFFGLE
ncbi:ArsC family reductase [Glaciecola petra]|uniref:ArsC family reductase n=1 Tax=Glaciecola petra TaxID=3075602 RepID=A0ABU2ZNE5_9ALTE|nr:ArsC family reductase [Aestuariibacter sp. P117]MDT0594148.1 ArsC family reductase [Aestuariibacter sp. P117]